MTTLAERLLKVQNAIDAILDGAQSISIGDRTYTRANLNALIALENQLQRRVNNELSHGRTVAEM
jgi:hypothetical protein